MVGIAAAARVRKKHRKGDTAVGTASVAYDTSTVGGKLRYWHLRGHGYESAIESFPIRREHWAMNISMVLPLT